MIPASKWADTIDQDIPIKMKEKIKAFFDFKRGLEEEHGYTRSRIINMDEKENGLWSRDLMVDRSFFFFFRR
jgi:hypothetical protein